MSDPIPAPGGGYLDPSNGAMLPSYATDPAAQQNAGIMQMQQYEAMMRAAQARQQPQAQAPTQAPAQAPSSVAGGYTDSNGMAPPQMGGTSSSGSTLTSALSNPLVGALLGAGLGAIGGGKYGAIGGALGGPMLGQNIANQMKAAQTQDPSTSLAALSARYLPLLAASYAGAFYHNATAPQYGKPASQSASLQTSTPTGAPKPKAGSWYTYGELPSYQLSAPGQARGGMQDPQMGGSSLTTGAVAAPSETGQRFIQGSGDGTSDDVNSRLARGEYVMDASTVSTLGNGSSDAGAEKLDAMRENIRKHAGQKMVKGKQFMKAKPPEKYLPGEGE
jgi:hypothetical protein